MGPLELLYGWQALLCAAACTGTAHLVKTIIDMVHDAKAKKLNEEAQAKLRDSVPPGGAFRISGKPPTLGTLKRKQSLIITRIILPMTPIVVGMVYANAVPFLPEQLTEWLAANDVPTWQVMLGKAAWGGACGQFSNYLYDRIKKTMEHLRSRPTS